MHAGLAAGEADDLALVQFAPALRRPQARPALDHDDELFLGQVPVVGVGGLAGRNLEEAEAEPLAARLPSQPGPLAAKAGLLARLVEVGLAYVRVSHVREPNAALNVPQYPA